MTHQRKPEGLTGLRRAAVAGVMAVCLGSTAPALAQDSDVPFGLIGVWTVQSFDGTPARPDAPMSIEFEESGTIAGSAGCNTLFGPLRDERGSIRLGPLAVTRKACQPDIMELEAAFLKVVGAVKGYRLEGNNQQLVLTDGGQTDLIVLTAGG
ncbi:hypothetical protein GCM10011316_15740 [Roseibium aquae]|uniref:DUF306 domain-containing protein n=1 Tax=Roseibium aquae TaxID=1323746 RepID=A0A916TJJ7_9HYPH|nr:META domain-containing protein [Roseibium aquae]GGB44555.1 hypothetical protein GCM10011316_15740 [Roseibium aquae]